MSWGTHVHSLKLSEDGSYTAFSKEYDEHYHSTKDGALQESLLKHVYPAFKIKEKLEVINILDICYGLGFNTLATLHYIKKNALTCRVNIYSPELDETLINSLDSFTYPKEFDEFKEIISTLARDKVYSDSSLHVELHVGDAREYIKQFDDKFDIVYQDAFSPSVNPALWTLEYFSDIKKAMKKDGVLTTYSIALATRLALYENGFNIYLNSGKEFRSSTVASLGELSEFLHVDMKHKIACNPDAKPLMD